MRLHVTTTKLILSVLANPARFSYSLIRAAFLSRAAQSANITQHSARPSIHAAITLTTSTSEAYSFASAPCAIPATKSWSPEPSYPALRYSLPKFRTSAWSATRSSTITAGRSISTLWSALTTERAPVIVVHPNNPTGNYVKAARAHAVERLRPREWLSSPTKCSRILSSKKPEHRGPANLCEECRRYDIHHERPFQNRGLPQMKAAWLVASGPDDLKAALERLEVISDTFLSMNAPIQHALPNSSRTRHDIPTRLLSASAPISPDSTASSPRRKSCSRLQVEARLVRDRCTARHALR